MKAAILLLVIGMLCFAFFASAIVPEPATKYIFTILPSGETNVEVRITGSGIISLPQDVLTPTIRGGTYESTDTGILVKADTEAVVEFTSSYYTKKEEGVWYFSTPLTVESKVTLILPAEVKVVQARPRPQVVRTSILTLSWPNVVEEITFSYVFLGKEYHPSEGMPSISSGLIVGVLGGLMGVGAVLYFWHRKKKSSLKPDLVKPSIEESHSNISEGQLNILRAANPNEALVLRTIVKHQGQVKRNMLEKETGLPKSSLASSLHNLEKKNLLQIDRTFSTHYIALTTWFKELK